MSEPTEVASAIHAVRGLLTDLRQGRGTRVRSSSGALSEMVREMQAVGAPSDLIYQVMRQYPEVAAELVPRRSRLSRLLERGDRPRNLPPLRVPVVHDQQMQLPAVASDDDREYS